MNQKLTQQSQNKTQKKHIFFLLRTLTQTIQIVVMTSWFLRKERLFFYSILAENQLFRLWNHFGFCSGRGWRDRTSSSRIQIFPPKIPRFIFNHPHTNTHMFTPVTAIGTKHSSTFWEIGGRSWHNDIKHSFFLLSFHFCKGWFKGKTNYSGLSAEDQLFRFWTNLFLGLTAEGGRDTNAPGWRMMEAFT